MAPTFNEVPLTNPDQCMHCKKALQHNDIYAYSINTDGKMHMGFHCCACMDARCLRSSDHGWVRIVERSAHDRPGRKHDVAALRKFMQQARLFIISEDEYDLLPT